MALNVKCPHCETLLTVPEKYHYQTVTCPNCGRDIEAISDETMELGQKFLKELEEMEGDVIIDESETRPHPPKKPA